MKRALLSVSNKTNIVDFAKGLTAHGYELVSTGGTAGALVEAGLSVIPISSVTGVPELMDGRVKTLHPSVHAGILARRDRSEDLRSIQALGIELIDIVVVNLYPFAQTAADSEATVDELIEQIDVGGPTLVRAAAKNFGHVIIVVDPDDYNETLSQLASPDGPSMGYRLKLAQKAFAHTQSYDENIASVLATVGLHGDRLKRRPAASEELAPDKLVVEATRTYVLRYGENPHQAGALYATGDVGFGASKLLQGKPLSFTNLLDLDAAARLVSEFAEPAAVVMKHMNPCGVATAPTVGAAYLSARDVDPLSAFGGIVGLNRQIEAETATAIVSTFIEAVVAPNADEAAKAILREKKNLRVVLADCSSESADLRLTREVRSILGGILIQDYDRVTEAGSLWGGETGGAAGLSVVTKRRPSDAEWAALRLAWRVSAHVKSNAIVFAVADRVVAIGAGQMSRVDAVRVAVMKATQPLLKTVAASDAFFPFRDGLDEIASVGATAVVQPGGSVRDDEVITAADEHGLAMVFTGRRHFRH